MWNTKVDLNDEMIDKIKKFFNHNDIATGHDLGDVLGINRFHKIDALIRELKEALIIEEAGVMKYRRYNVDKCPIRDIKTNQFNLF